MRDMKIEDIMLAIDMELGHNNLFPANDLIESNLSEFNKFKGERVLIRFEVEDEILIAKPLIVCDSKQMEEGICDNIEIPQDRLKLYIQTYMRLMNVSFLWIPHKDILLSEEDVEEMILVG